MTTDINLDYTYRLFDAGDVFRLQALAPPGTPPPMEEIIPKDKLPQWVKERLAILQMLEAPGSVEGIGVRVDDRTFWLTTKEEKPWP